MHGTVGSDGFEVIMTRAKKTPSVCHLSEDQNAFHMLFLAQYHSARCNKNKCLINYTNNLCTSFCALSLQRSEVRAHSSQYLVHVEPIKHKPWRCQLRGLRPPLRSHTQNYVSKLKHNENNMKNMDIN